METEKVYYAVLILVCAASMLLSPFFYIRRSQAANELQQPPKPKRWAPIFLANLVMVAALLFVWWKWF